MTSLLIIDSQVEGFEAPFEDFESDREVLRLSAEEDGVEQIARYLSGGSDYDASDIFSHCPTATSSYTIATSMLRWSS